MENASSQPWSWLTLALSRDADIGFAVDTGTNGPIHLVGYIQGQFLFCCSPVISSNNTCAKATKGSYEPFSLEAGQIIFNRTSGSTSTDIASAATVTETAAFTDHATATDIVTVTASPSTSASVPSTSLSCSSKEAAVGAGLGVTLGLALSVALGLLWRQKRHKQSLRTEIQTWEWRCNELTSKVVTFSGAEQQSIYQLPGWTPSELDGRPKTFPSEMADKPG